MKGTEILIEKSILGLELGCVTQKVIRIKNPKSGRMLLKMIIFTFGYQFF
jgi:hypothetical protein